MTATALVNALTEEKKMDDDNDMMTWDYRFVNMPSSNGGEDWIELREVCYNNDGSLMGHADPCLGSETVEGVKLLAKWLLRASEQPVLHEKDFPPGFDSEADQ